MNKPLLHVVIPAYGQSPYLKETLLSATSKLAANVPITVLEDPSESNNVREVVSDFLGRVDYQINPSRLGIGGNFNKAIEISTGVFTWICGSDDLILSDPTEELMKFSEVKNIASIITQVKVIDKNGNKSLNVVDALKKLIGFTFRKKLKFSYNGFLNRLLLGYWPYFPAIFWSTQVLKVERFSNEFNTALDLDLLLRVNRKRYKIYKINKLSLAYRRHSQSQSSQLAQNNLRFIEEFKCHRNLITNNKDSLKLFSQFLVVLSISIRMHCVYYYLKSLILHKKNKKELFKLIFYWK